MKKEEILEASKRENKKKDIYEIEVESKGSNYAAIAMLLLALVFFSYEIFSGKGSNPAFYSIITISSFLMCFSFTTICILIFFRKSLFIY